MEYQLNDFTCCPKCTTSVSKGRLVEDPCFVDGPISKWLMYIKCINCGWRYELKTNSPGNMVVFK